MFRSALLRPALMTAALVLALHASAAWAHFVWLARVGDEVRVYFAESPEPDRAALVKKIAHTKLQFLPREGKPAALEGKEVTDGDNGYLSAAAKGAGDATAVCLYGIYKENLLHYYARSQQIGAKPAAEHELPLNVSAISTDDGLAIVVRFDGNPRGGVEVFVTTPDDKEQELKTDDDGRVVLKEALPGEYAVRAALVEPAAGELNGQKYQRVMHQSTLTFALPGMAAEPAKPAAAATSVDPTKEMETKEAATKLLAESRATRAVWENFPGMTAQFAANADGKSAEGTLSISAGGDVSVKFTGEPPADTQKWTQRVVTSLVQHRIPSGDFAIEATFGEDSELHPLGRKLKLAQDLMGSVYRVRDKIVTQVNRTMEEQRFTISVLDVYRNAEGKYAPTVFTVSFWDEKTGELMSSETHQHRYERVEKWDMPMDLLEISAGRDSYHARSLKFSDWQPLKVDAATAK